MAENEERKPDPEWFVAHVGDADHEGIWVLLNPLKYGQDEAPAPASKLTYVKKEDA